MEVKVTEIETWLEKQMQLPQGIDSNVLKRFLYSTHGDLTRTKHMLDVHYRLRGKHHGIFIERDPHSHITHKVLNAIDFLELPGKTQDNCKLWLYRFHNAKAAKFSFAEAMKVYFMMTDCQFSCDFDAATEGDVIVIDMKDFNLQHLARINLSYLKIVLKFLQKAHPVRLKHMHFINCPSYVEKFMKISVNSKYFRKMHFYVANEQKLDEKFPRDLLPLEYGGKAGELAELRRFWLQQLHEKRIYLMDDTLW